MGKVKKGQRLEEEKVFCRNDNLFLYKLREEKNAKTLTIIGNGEHMTVEDNVISDCKRGLKIPEEEEYQFLRGDIVMFYFTSKKRSLRKVAKELAKVINEKCDKYTSIVLIGEKNSSECFVNMTPYLQRKVRIATIYSYDPFLVKKSQLSFKDLLWNKKLCFTNIDTSMIGEHRWIIFVSPYCLEKEKKMRFFEKEIKKGFKTISEYCNVQYHASSTQEALEYFKS